MIATLDHLGHVSSSSDFCDGVACLKMFLQHQRMVRRQLVIGCSSGTIHGRSIIMLWLTMYCCNLVHQSLMFSSSFP